MEAATGQSVSVYEQNLRLLEAYDQALAKVVRDCSDDSYAIRRLPSGDIVLCVLKDGQWDMVHSAAKSTQDAVAADVDGYVAQIEKLQNTGFVLYGMDAGMRLLFLFQRTDEFCPIFVIEKNLGRIKALLRAHDMRVLIASRRVFFFAGNSAAEDAVRFLQADYPGLYPLTGALLAPKEDEAFYRQASKAVSACMKKMIGQLMENVRVMETHYAAVDVHRLREVFSGSLQVPLRVMGVVCKATNFMQYAMRDCMQAFGALGHMTCVIETEKGAVCNAYMTQVVKNFLPDLWFKINQSSRQSDHVPESLVTVTWMQDHMRDIFDPHIPADKKVGRYDQMLVMTRHFMDELLAVGIPESKLHYFHFASNPAIYHPMELTGEDRQRYKSDIVFIAHAPGFYDAYNYLPRAVVDEVRDRMIREERYYPADFKEIVQSLKPRHGEMHTDMNTLLSFVWPVMAQETLRIPYLEALNDKDIAIYGDGWERYPSLSAHARGRAQNGTEVCTIYNAGKININLHQSSNNHPRVFDIIASGGFLLTRLTPEDMQPGGIQELFDIGREIEVFSSKEELVRKVEYYLAYDDERRAIARRGYERLMRQHTYRHRMQQVLSIVSQGLTRE